MVLLLLTSTLSASQIAIDFRGNRSFSKSTLYKALGIERSWWQRILFRKERPKVDDRLLPILMEELENFYRDQGFWDVEVEITLEGDVAVFIIHENEPILVKSIEITSDFPIASLIPLKEGERFVASAFTNSKRAIRQALLEGGYCSYDFDAKAFIYRKRRSAYLVYRLQKGAPCIVGRIDVRGLQSISDDVVLTHIDLRPGEPFSLDRVRESYRRLYSLDYFRFINIDYSRKVANRILLQIDARERKRRHIYKVGLGYDTQNGIHASYYYKNVNINQFQPTLQLYHSKIRKSAELSIFYPSIHLLDSYFDTVTTIGYEKNRYDSFTQKGYRLGGRFITEYYNIWSFIEFHLEHIEIKSRSDCVRSKTYTLLYPELFALLDKRDSKLAPTKGFFLQDRLHISLLGDKFLKNEITGGILMPMDPFTLFLKGRVGVLFADSIPPNKRFYAGGAKSNRAYTYQQITALDSRCKIGGKTLLETTIEPRYRYSKNMTLALFWDRTYLSAKEFHIGPYRDGVGLGLIYNTPIGQLKAYFGFDLQRPSQNAINLYLGASF